MREQAIIRFLAALGVDDSMIRVEREWVNSVCPMSPYTHESGQDKRPSFGIRINDEGPSAYYCFGCTPEGRLLHWLLHNDWIATGVYPWEAAEIYLKEEIHSDDDALDSIPKFIDPWEDDEDEEILPIPNYIIRQYPMLQWTHTGEAEKCREFLVKERGIPVWIANMCKVRIDDNAPGLVFPLTDLDGNIFTMRVRSRLAKEMWTVSPKYAGYPHLKFPKIRHTGVMFNLWQIDWRKPIMVVESELDVLKAIYFGFYNIVASASSSITGSQIDNLLRARTIICGGDADKSGREMNKRISIRVGKKANLLTAPWALAMNKKDEPCKDLGEILCKEDFVHVMRNVV